MGYYVDGYITIVASEANLVEAALHVDRLLAESRDTHLGAVLVDSYRNAAGDVMERALEASGFEDLDVDRGRTDGNTVYSGHFRTKWREELTGFVATLASAAHMTVDATFTGEDDERWAWQTTNGAFREVTLVPVDCDRVSELEAAEATVKSIEENLLDLDDAALAAGVRALFAARTHS